jgi:hypothetical protein
MNLTIAWGTQADWDSVLIRFGLVTFSDVIVSFYTPMPWVVLNSLPEQAVAQVSPGG